MPLIYQHPDTHGTVADMPGVTWIMVPGATGVAADTLALLDGFGADHL